MSQTILERQLKKKSLKSIYLFYGEEEFLIRRALAHLEDWLRQEADLAGKTVLETGETSLAEAVAAARSPQLWGGRQLIVLWLGERLKAAELAPLGQYLKAPSASTCLVLVALKLKPKDVQGHSLWKVLQEQEAALGFPRLREGELPAWLEREAKRQGKTLGPGAARLLMEVGGFNLADLHQELEKLILYTGAEPTITPADVTQLGSHSRTHTIFELVEALGQSRPDKALKVLDRLLELGEPPALILVMIARQVRLLLRTREGLKKRLSTEALAQELGVYKNVAEKLQRQAAGFRLGQLQGHLIRLHVADQNLKTGMAAPRLLLEKVVLDLCPLPALKKLPGVH